MYFLLVFKLLYDNHPSGSTAREATERKTVQSKNRFVSFVCIPPDVAGGPSGGFSTWCGGWYHPVECDARRARMKNVKLNSPMATTSVMANGYNQVQY